MTSSSSMNACWPAGPGSGTKRGTTWLGMWTTVSEVWGSALAVAARTATTRQSDRLARCGNGWPGSMASGVRTGIRVRWKYPSRKRSWSGVTSLGRTSRIPSEARIGPRSSRKQRCWASTRRWTLSEIAARVSAGERPSGPVVGSPARIRRFSSATLTMKNSSRFELKIARNFTRSSSGTEESWASSRTRRLNSSQEISRLTKTSDGRAIRSGMGASLREAGQEVKSQNCYVPLKLSVQPIQAPSLIGKSDLTLPVEAVRCAGNHTADPA